MLVVLHTTPHKEKCDKEAGVERVNGLSQGSENILHFAILFSHISWTPYGALGWAVQVGGS